MRGVLVDTGPLVAVIDADDVFHERCVQALKEIREPLFTLWPVITETMHLVGSPTVQERLWDVLEAQGLRLLALDTAEIPGMRALMKKYANLPMDLADAALVRVAEREGLHTVFTIDQGGLWHVPTTGRQEVPPFAVRGKGKGGRGKGKVTSAP